MIIMPKLLLFLLGRTALLAGCGFLLPLVAALIERSPLTMVFAMAALFSLALGILLCALCHQHRSRLSIREGAAFLLLAWLELTGLGMLPYLASGELPLLDAFFESVSSLTTTGISCLRPDAPHLLVLWRSVSQWLGGLNILVLLTTVLPQVSGCFGISFAVQKSIHSGQLMISRMERTAFTVVRIYAVLTIIGCLLYACGGLSLFDAVNLSMVTLSTGGCYVPSSGGLTLNGWLIATILFGMLVSSGNFLLYWQSITQRKIRHILLDTELRAFLLLILGAGAFVAWHLWRLGVYGPVDSLLYGFFHVVSFAGTTGLFADRIADWPDFDKFVLFLLPFVGGCIGSLAGGFKMLRFIILGKTALTEMRRTLHPHMVVHIGVDGSTVPQKIIGRILSFFFLYFIAFFTAVLVISLSGVSELESMNIAAGCLTSTGQLALLDGSPMTILGLSNAAKLFCCFLMILGKLEIFSFLIVLQAGYLRLQHSRW